jgi:sulfur relay (sulfurtransferase) DsrF/TusC family protein
MLSKYLNSYIKLNNIFNYNKWYKTCLHAYILHMCIHVLYNQIYMYFQICLHSLRESYFKREQIICVLEVKQIASRFLARNIHENDCIITEWRLNKFQIFQVTTKTIQALQLLKISPWELNITEVYHYVTQ